MIPISTLLALAALGFTLYCAWTLIRKTGYEGWLALLFVIPVVNLVLWCYFAFTEWPIEAELRRYRERYGPLPEEKQEDDMREDTICLQCGVIIPSGTAACPACGWTYTRPPPDAGPEA